MLPDGNPLNGYVIDGFTLMAHFDKQRNCHQVSISHMDAAGKVKRKIAQKVISKLLGGDVLLVSIDDEIESNVSHFEAHLKQ